MDVVLMRHGESEANFENYWTGWLDVSLTEKGQEQARKAGEKIKNAQIEFDAAFTSVLKRASLTCQIILEESDQLWIPTFKTWRLNERHYGALVGKNKDEMAREFGADQVKRWITGHGNSLRALVKYLEDVPEDQMDTIDIPNAQPIHYRFDKNLQIVNKSIL